MKVMCFKMYFFSAASEKEASVFIQINQSANENNSATTNSFVNFFKSLNVLNNSDEQVKEFQVSLFKVLIRFAIISKNYVVESNINLV